MEKMKLFLNKAKNAGKSFLNYSGFGLVVSNVLLLLLFALIPLGNDSFPNFYNFPTFSMMLSNNAIYGILAVGIMIVLLTGGIDLSIGSTLAVSAVSTAKLAYYHPNVPIFLWLILGICIGAFCGLINGILVGKLKIVPLIATIATMYIYRGLAFLISNGEWFIDAKISSNFKSIAKTQILGFDSIVWILVVIILLAAFFLCLTKTGRRIYAVGSSEKSAEISGFNTGNIKLLSYAICGTLAGLAGVLFVSNDALAHSEIGLNYELTAIAICAIGGVSIFGGKGRIDCLTLGFIFMTLLSKLLSSLGTMTHFEEIFKGCIIILALAINTFDNYVKQKRNAFELGGRA